MVADSGAEQCGVGKVRMGCCQELGKCADDPRSSDEAFERFGRSEQRGLNVAEDTESGWCLGQLLQEAILQWLRQAWVAGLMCS